MSEDEGNTPEDDHFDPTEIAKEMIRMTLRHKHKYLSPEDLMGVYNEVIVEDVMDQ